MKLVLGFVLGVAVAAVATAGAASRRTVYLNPGDFVYYKGVGCQAAANGSASLACIRSGNPAGVAVIIGRSNVLVFRGKTVVWAGR